MFFRKLWKILLEDCNSVEMGALDFLPPAFNIILKREGPWPSSRASAMKAESSNFNHWHLQLKVPRRAAASIVRVDNTALDRPMF